MAFNIIAIFIQRISLLSPPLPSPPLPSPPLPHCPFHSLSSSPHLSDED